MRLFAAVLLALPLCAQDARQIVLRSLERDEEASRIARQYTFLQRVERRELDDRGQVKKRESQTHDITLLEGTPYSRLVARNDQPLPPEEERKEQEKLRKSIESRAKETPAERARRLAEVEAKRRKQLEELRQIPEAFDLRIAGEETVDGHPAWIIEGTPRRGYHPRGGITRLFPKLKGRIWIVKSDYHWIKAEAEAIDTISIGLFLARIHKGTRATIEQARINDEVWLPRHLTAEFSGRIALVKRLHGEVDITYKDFKKFQADSRVVAFSAP